MKPGLFNTLFISVVFVICITFLNSFILAAVAGEQALSSSVKKTTSTNTVPLKAHAGEKVKQGLFTITGYCADTCCCDEYADGYTATGKIAVEENRIIAVDPEVIPLHSMVYIDGLGVFHAEDVGGMIKGKRIDILMDKHLKAVNFGVQKREVTVLTLGYVSRLKK